jgi:hypothetical protein
LAVTCPASARSLARLLSSLEADPRDGPSRKGQSKRPFETAPRNVTVAPEARSAPRAPFEGPDPVARKTCGPGAVRNSTRLSAGARPECFSRALQRGLASDCQRPCKWPPKRSCRGPTVKHPVAAPGTGRGQKDKIPCPARGAAESRCGESRVTGWRAEKARRRPSRRSFRRSFRKL